ESTVLIGALLIILALAQGFNKYLTLAQIAEHSILLLENYNLTPVGFLLLLNILLLIVGCFMDILSAILILVPLLSPIAVGLGIHPMHLAIVVIVNLEIGYLTPPLGLNLFVASTIFRKGLGDVIRSVLPFMFLMFCGLMIITYVPTVSLGAVSLRNGESFIVPFPEKRIAMHDIEVDDAIRFLSSLAEEEGVDEPAEEEAPADPGRPLTIEEMMAASNAQQEAEALDGLAYEGAAEMLEDYRRIFTGVIMLEEVGLDE
ncbi:MAG: C4-dicarboxylate transporter DctM subunit, partial [Bradymonadia bacterium]